MTEKKPINIFGLDNAHITDDYPYGFRFRTERKEWIESKTDKKGNLKGQRFCTQTKDPKTGKWNNPKCSTYSDIMIGIEKFDESLGKNIIDYDILRMNDTEQKISEFEQTYKDILLPVQKEKMKDLVAWDRAMKHVKWEVKPSSEIKEEERQTPQDQARILNQLTNYERKKMN